MAGSSIGVVQRGNLVGRLLVGDLSKLRGGEAKISIIDPKSYMTYQPFLPEAAAGTWPSVTWLLRFGRSCAV